MQGQATIFKANSVCTVVLSLALGHLGLQVTAPVRETAAQALGVTMAAMDLGTVKRVMALLEQLQRQPEWDVRWVPVIRNLMYSTSLAWYLWVDGRPSNQC